MKSYLTVTEFAKAAGISKQSVYQRLNTSLKKYSRVEQGKKVIDSKALREIYGIGLEQDFQGNSQDFQGENQGLNQMVNVLQEQLKEKDKQIERLQSLLDQQQKLNMIDKQRILALEEKQKQEDPEPAPVEKDPQRKGFFARLLRL